MSFRSMLMRRSCGRRDVAGRLLERPELAAEGELLVVVELLVVEHQHAELVHAGMDGGDLRRRTRRRVRSMPETSPAKNARVTGSMGLMSMVMAPV